MVNALLRRGQFTVNQREQGITMTQGVASLKRKVKIDLEIK